ncbi:MAG TPA: DinB family protein [Gemmatimonadales bacterium]|jgi:hypothetical protein
MNRSTRILAGMVALAACAAPLAAQSVPDRASAVEVRKQFMADLDTMYTKLTALANAFPADKFAWRPAPGVRSVGEVFMHVASEFYVYTPMSFGATRSPAIPRAQDAMTKFEAQATKDDVLRHLKEGHDYVTASVMAVPPDSLAGTRKLFGRDFTIVETSVAMTADMHEHLGQLIAYARMNGVVPPWSK